MGYVKEGVLEGEEKEGEAYFLREKGIDVLAKQFPREWEGLVSVSSNSALQHISEGRRAMNPLILQFIRAEHGVNALERYLRHYIPEYADIPGEYLTLAKSFIFT